MVMRETAIVFAQVPLLKSQLEQLKRRTGMVSIEDAVQTAVDHYLGCPAIREREREMERKKEQELEFDKEEGVIVVPGRIKKTHAEHEQHRTRTSHKVLAMEMDIITKVKRLHR